MIKAFSGLLSLSTWATMCILVSACGSGGSGPESSVSELQLPATDSGSSGVLSISGAPPSSVTQGVAYSFIPGVSGSGGETLVFDISNLPAWADFDTATGELSGSPSSGDVGLYTNIGITVSSSSGTASLSPFSIEVVGTATGTATLSWDIPVQNADGSQLTDLAGFRIHYGTSAGNYPNTDVLSNPTVSTHIVEELTPGTWYFVVSAYDTSGNRSDYSNSVSKTL